MKQELKLFNKGDIKETIVRKTLLSDEFLDFMERNMLPFKSLMTYYQCALMRVETKFKVLNEEFSLQYDRNPIESIKSRLKSFDSLARKIRKRDLTLNLEEIEKNITDIAGIRVICSFVDDIYLLADCILNQDDVTLIEKKDYIKKPKESGYRSLHLIISIPIYLQNEKKDMKVEIQLRTIAMDFWASLEHQLRYKKKVPQNIQDYLANEMIECANISNKLDVRMQEVFNEINKIKDEEE